MTKQRSGSFGSAPTVVAPDVRHIEANVLRELLKVSARPEIISLAGGSPASDLIDVEGIRSAAELALGGDAVARLQYGGSEGTVQLRERIADLMRKRGVPDADPERIIVTTGSSQGIDLIGRTLLQPGDVAATQRPTFLAALTMIALARATVAEIGVDEDVSWLERAERCMRDRQPKLLYVMPTFANPSGVTLTEAERLGLLELAVETETVIVEDDPYGELWFDEPPADSLFALRHRVPGAEHLCVHLGSLSKVLAPGLRLGWLMASDPILEKVAVVKQVADAHTSTLDQAIAVNYLDSGRLADRLPSMRAEYGRRANWLSDALVRHMPEGSLDFAAPTGGMFIWSRVRDVGAPALADAALEQEVAIVPGEPFHASPPDAAFIRLSYSQLDEATADEAARRLAIALGSVGRT